MDHNNYSVYPKDGGISVCIEELTNEQKVYIRAEIERRYAADAEAAATAKAEKEAKEAEKEREKMEYLHRWILNNGTPSQVARQKDGLLCRDEAIKALDDYVFAAVALYNFKDYESNLTAPNCTSEDCYEACHMQNILATMKLIAIGVK